MAVDAIQPAGEDAAAVWLVEGGVHSVRLFRAPIWCSSGEEVAREGRGALSRKAW